MIPFPVIYRFIIYLITLKCRFQFQDSFSVFIRTAHIQIFQKCIRASAAFKTDLIVISTFFRSKFHVFAVVSFTAYRNCIMISCSHGTVTIFYFDVCTSVIFYLNNRIRRLDFKMYIYFFVSLKLQFQRCFHYVSLHVLCKNIDLFLTTANIFQCITVRSFLHFDTATVQIKLRDFCSRIRHHTIIVTGFI